VLDAADLEAGGWNPVTWWQVLRQCRTTYRGSPRMLAIAARKGDIVSLLPMLGPGAEIDEREIGPDGFDQKIALVRDAAGDRFPHLELNGLIQGLAVTDVRA
jgi:hypothetical protein